MAFRKATFASTEVALEIMAVLVFPGNSHIINWMMVEDMDE